MIDFHVSGVTSLTFAYSSSADGSGEILTSAPSSDVSRLPQILDLTQASILREQMKALIGFGAIRLDAADVLSMSTPCIQILLATGYAAESFGTTLQIVNASAAFEVAVTDLGLQSHFNHWMA